MSSIVVAGVPGVGRSQLCTDARRQLGDGFKLLNFGDVMLEEAVEHQLVEDREELGSLPIDDLRLLQHRASDLVTQLAREDTVIVDTHLTVRTERGLLPGLSETVLRNVNPEAFVLVEADPVEVIEHRESDTVREFGTQSARSIEFQQQLDRAAAVSYAMQTAAPVSVLYPEDDETDSASRLADLAEAIAPA